MRGAAPPVGRTSDSRRRRLAQRRPVCSIDAGFLTLTSRRRASDQSAAPAGLAVRVLLRSQPAGRARPLERSRRGGQLAPVGTLPGHSPPYEGPRGRAEGVGSLDVTRPGGPIFDDGLPIRSARARCAFGTAPGADSVVISQWRAHDPDRRERSQRAGLRRCVDLLEARTALPARASIAGNHPSSHGHRRALFNNRRLRTCASRPPLLAQRGRRLDSTRANFTWMLDHRLVVEIRRGRRPATGLLLRDLAHSVRRISSPARAKSSVTGSTSAGAISPMGLFFTRARSLACGSPEEPVVIANSARAAAIDPCPRALSAALTIAGRAPGADTVFVVQTGVPARPCGTGFSPSVLTRTVTLALRIKHHLQGPTAGIVRA